MKTALASLIIVAQVVLVACPAPVALQNALQKQSEEIQIVSKSYPATVISLLDTIEKLQLEIVNKVDAETRAQKYFEKEIGKPATKSTDPNLLIIAVETDKILNQFFNGKRDEVRSKIAVAKAEYLKLSASIDNIDKINKAAKEYIDSLVELRRETRAMAQLLASKASTVASGGTLDVTKLQFFTIPELLKRPNP